MEFVTNSFNTFGYSESETPKMSENSIKLRDIHDAKSEKCAILEWNIKDLKRQHQLDLQRKDEIISNLTVELEIANNMIKQAGNEHDLKAFAANCTLEDRNLSSTQMNSREKAVDDIYHLESKCLQSKLERLALVFERKPIDSGKVSTNLNYDTLTFQEKINKTNGSTNRSFITANQSNNMEQSTIDATTELSHLLILHKEALLSGQRNVSTSQLSADNNRELVN